MRSESLQQFVIEVKTCEAGDKSLQLWSWFKVVFRTV